MNRPRSSSITRQKFSHCDLVELIHLHDCLRGALFEFLNDVNALVKSSVSIDNMNSSNDDDYIDGTDSDISVSVIRSMSSASSCNSVQQVDSSEEDIFDVHRAANLSSQVASRFHLIWSVFQAHSGAEDEFIWPTLKRKVAEQQANDPTCEAPEGSSSCTCAKSLFGQHEYEEDHLEEETMFKQLNTTLIRLLGSFRYYVSHNRTTQSRRKALNIIRQVILMLKKQVGNLVEHLQVHLEKEETECLPIVKQLLSDAEISTLVGKIMGKRSAEMTTKILNLALCSLPEEERADMVAHMKKAATGTYFEKWLEMGEWGRQEKQLKNTGSPNVSPLGPRSLAGGNLKRRIPALPGISNERPKKLKKVTSSQANLCQMTNDRNSRSRHPSRWYTEDENGDVSLVWSSSDPESTDPEILATVPVFTQDELTPKYHFTSTQGGPVLGCDHYARSCKLRHPETGALHTCRLCAQEQREAISRLNPMQHNYCQEVSPPPILNRNDVCEILCMQCGALQPVGASCINPDCAPEQPFAKYCCMICRLFDDAPSKDIYHCPYCNACRKGKGLDIDFQHCMTCNACIAIDDYEGHACIPQRLEGNCPICQEEMFESTVPLRGLKCGHAMHLSCFDNYIASCGTSRKITCPHCKVGIDDMRG